jgi:hypothetical protein
VLSHRGVSTTHSNDAGWRGIRASGDGAMGRGRSKCRLFVRVDF